MICSRSKLLRGMVCFFATTFFSEMWFFWVLIPLWHLWALEILAKNKKETFFTGLIFLTVFSLQFLLGFALEIKHLPIEISFLPDKQKKSWNPTFNVNFSPFQVKVDCLRIKKKNRMRFTGILLKHKTGVTCSVYWVRIFFLFCWSIL